MEVFLIDSKEILLKAYSWFDDKPRRFRTAIEKYRKPFEGYYADAQSDKQLDFGVFRDGELIALITMTGEGNDEYDTHFDCPIKTDFDDIFQASAIVFNFMVAHGAKSLVAQTLRQNRTLKKVLLMLGYLPTYCSVTEIGADGKTVIEWEQFRWAKNN
jgi:hypothetical protein